jgi:hypothetical protein
MRAAVDLDQLAALQRLRAEPALVSGGWATRLPWTARWTAG